MINLAVLLLRDKMRGRRGWLYGVLVLVIGVVLILAGVGVADLFGFEVSNRIRSLLQPVKDWFQPAQAFLQPVTDRLAKLI